MSARVHLPKSVPLGYPLGVPPPDEAVAVLDGAFLPGGVGACVVDAASDDGLYLLGVEELAAVVGRDGAHLAEGLARDHSPERRDDVVLRDVLQLLDDVAPAPAVDEDEQAAGPVRRRDDGVHLVVPEAAAPLRARGPVVEREAPRDRHGGMGLRTLRLPVRMVRGLAVPYSDVSGVDVLVPCRQARDALPGHLLLHAAESVVRRQPFVDHVPSEEEGHLIRHQHPGPLVRVALVDRVLRLEGVVFGVLASSPVLRVRDGGPGGPAQVFASPGLVFQPVLRGELAERDPASRPDDRVPVRCQRLAMDEIQVCTGHVLCGIILHGVLSLALMVWFGHLHHTTDCDAFGVFSARDAP